MKKKDLKVRNFLIALLLFLVLNSSFVVDCLKLGEFCIRSDDKCDSRLNYTCGSIYCSAKSESCEKILGLEKRIKFIKL